jgi:carbamoyltransferase
VTHSSTTNYHLGISQGYHDAGLAYISPDGNILHASHSERYSKKKNDPNLSYQQFVDCEFTGFENITVNYYERPWLTNLRRLRSGQKLSSITPVINKLKYFDLPRKMNKWGHHLSHAAAAFQTSPFDHSAVVIVDAIGEWDTASIWYAHYDDKGVAKYQRLWHRKYPHSLGLFYTAMTKHVGLRPMEDEYVLMGMSAYGSPHMLYEKMRKDFVESIDECKFKQNFHAGIDETWSGKFKDEHVASAAQKLTEEILYSIHERALDITNETNVCYGGGVALNCKFNAKLHELWSNIWICPNPGDCGSALGAAALSYGKKLNWQNAYLGHMIVGDLNVNRVVETLVKEKIVGVANSYAEWGPRALGNRSLLANPRGEAIKDRVNDIKKRQKYRPFAPAILEEHAKDYFNLNSACDYRYMQYAVKANENTQMFYPAVCHIDGTARVQVVPKDGSNMRNILEAWYAKTKCPMLLNTSLNIRGEPMIDSRVDAQRFTKMYGVKVFS